MEHRGVRIARRVMTASLESSGRKKPAEGSDGRANALARAHGREGGTHRRRARVAQDDGVAARTKQAAALDEHGRGPRMPVQGVRAHAGVEARVSKSGALREVGALEAH